MKSRALRSVLAMKFRAYWVARTRLGLRGFPLTFADFPHRRCPLPLGNGFILPCASFSFRVLRAQPALRLPAPSTFLGVHSPIAATVIGVHFGTTRFPSPPRHGLPKPASFRPRRFSRPRRLPPPTTFVGLFHPTATSGVRSSGFFPLMEPHELIARRCPLVGYACLSCPGLCF